MVDRRAARVAAMVMAGLVGAAVVAPGLAMAQETTTPSSSALCDVTGTCPEGGSSTSSTGTMTASPLSGGSSSTPSAPAVPVPELDLDGPGSSTDPSAPASSDPTTAPPSAAPSTGPDDSADGTSPATRALVAELQDTLDDAERENTLAAEGSSRAALVPDEDAPAPLEELTGLLTPAQVTQFFPEGLDDDATAEDFQDNPRQSCAFFVSQLTSADPTGLGAQFASFCSSLPTEFGLEALPGLEQLTDALNNLADALPKTPEMSGVATEQELSAYESEFYPYSGGQDLDCADFAYSGSTAQSVYEQDTSDPNGLDGDSDGLACEDGVSDASYSGYPTGGVATGDSGTPTDAAHAGSLALALVMTSGLAAAGTARRRTRTTTDA